MSKITDPYYQWVIENLPWYDQIIVLGMAVWLHARHYLPLPKVDLGSPQWWSEPVFFLVGLIGNQYYQLSEWWQELLINWVLRSSE